MLGLAGIQWIAYSESMPTPCDPQNSGEYVVRHNPVPYFGDLGGNVSGSICETHDLPISNLTRDYPYTATPPAFTFIAPNLLNDGHDTSAAVADWFLSQFIPKLENTSWFGSSAIFITYDESYGTSPDSGYDGLDGGPVYMVSVSNYSRGMGAVDSINDSHYNLLSTIEWLLGLPGTVSGHDGTAEFPAMKGLFSFGTPLRPRATANVTAGIAPLEVQFTGNATGGLPPYRYDWNFGDGTNGSLSNMVHTFAAPGSYRIELDVTDAANDTAVTNLTVRVGNATLMTGISASTVAGLAPDPVTFTAAPAGGVAPYNATWSFGDGSRGFGLVASHTYLTAGTFVATAHVSDSGNGLVISSLTVRVYAPLTIGIYLPAQTVEIGAEVNATSQVAGGWPGSYGFQWTINGAPAANGTGQSLEFLASTAGVDRLAVTVVDSGGGQANASSQLNVTGGYPGPTTAAPPSLAPTILTLVAIAAVAIIVAVMIWNRQRSR